MSVVKALENTLLTSINTLNASIDVGHKTAIATGKTVDAVGNTIETSANNANKLTTAATDLTGETANTVQKFVKSVGDNSDKLVTTSADATVIAVKSLTDQLANTNKITTTLMTTANDSLKKSSGNISDSIGDASNMASTFTKTALETVKFSSVVIITILKILTSPFSTIESKIESIKKERDSPIATFEKIKKAYIDSYNVMSNDLTKNFNKQVDNMITNANNLLKLYKQLGCKKTFFGQYDCSESKIKNTITIINENYAKMLYEKTDFISKLKIIFAGFKSTSSMGWSVNEGNLDSKINEMGNMLVNEQNEIVTKATNLLQTTISSFKNKYLDPIKESIEELNKTPFQPTTQGGRPPRKSRKTKRNKKSKKTKSRRSK
jgi:hypothetical protein